MANSMLDRVIEELLWNYLEKGGGGETQNPKALEVNKQAHALYQQLREILPDERLKRLLLEYSDAEACAAIELIKHYFRLGCLTGINLHGEIHKRHDLPLAA